jgi:hypothetical protein
MNAITIEPLLFWDVITYLLVTVASAFVIGFTWSLRKTHEQLAQSIDIETRIKVWRRGLSNVAQPANAIGLLYISLNYASKFPSRFAIITVVLAVLTAIFLSSSWRQQWNRPVIEDRAPTPDIEEPLMRRWSHYLLLSSIGAVATLLSTLVGIYFKIPENIKNMRISYYQ